ncbi:uncharacterized protein [Lolium perenne]|uniref:uncharacterized protein isoform X2 n=1 Tax=Lolium perenne TaxID=4522 RepID=UPI0021F590A1|nr:uncharacterized protein LOC127340661 isoform X2 [Lolium perenne]
MDGTLMVSRGCGDAHQLKDLSNTEDSRRINTEDSTQLVINPLLLASACLGSWRALIFLLDREDAQKPPVVMHTQAFIHLLMSDGAAKQPPENDIEEGVDQHGLPAVSAPLLEGVTVEGDTALHVVASHGDDRNYLNCASIIYERAKHLLFVLNVKGDTPLHCAARAGKSKMVSQLINLVIASEDAKHELLRKVNWREETALHDSIRIGDNHIVDLLMTADAQLANYPRESMSPLYLAILLDKYIIVSTLFDRSKGNLSYSGPNGQNALHAAIHRSKAKDIFDHPAIMVIYSPLEAYRLLHLILGSIDHQPTLSGI